jgi:hypothetical protein
MRHAMADTDSITFMRPAGMERAAFWELVDAVRRQMQRLSPYHDEEDFLELEDENIALRPDGRGGMEADRSRREPLYAICVSPKRYCVHAEADDGVARSTRCRDTPRSQLDSVSWPDYRAFVRGPTANFGLEERAPIAAACRTKPLE